MLYDLRDALQKENFKVRCNALFKQGAVVELTEKKPKRTIKQNSYLHLSLSYFASQYGCTLEYAKENYFKILCNKDIFVREKEDKFLGTITVLRSTKDLDTKEMTDAIETFRNWSACEAGIYIPSANEGDLVTLMEVEVERNKHYL